MAQSRDITLEKMVRIRLSVSSHERMLTRTIKGFACKGDIIASVFEKITLNRVMYTKHMGDSSNCKEKGELVERQPTNLHPLEVRIPTLLITIKVPTVYPTSVSFDLEF